MSCFIDLAGAISESDDSLRLSYVIGVKSTTFFAMGLMEKTIHWLPVLENDKTQAVLASMSGESNSAALASAWNMQYQKDSQAKDIECGQWESFVQGDQTQINTDSDARKANFSLADGMAATCSTINSLINQVQ